MKPRAFTENQTLKRVHVPRNGGKKEEFLYKCIMNENLKLPPGHKQVATEDGSWTLFSEAFQEACHSTAGAKSETILHYINGCKVPDKIQMFDPLVILEVGFGLGIGFLTTYEMLPKDKKWIFVSMELDRGLLEWFKETQSQHELLKALVWEENILSCKNEHVELIIIQGDARVELQKFLQKRELIWHAVYQDAFSPKKNPRLWTREWFDLLKAYSHPEVTLSTYSASNSIRKSLHETGWCVHKGEKFGPKRTSTRASLIGNTDPEILLQMDRSPALALTDLQIDSIDLK